MFLLLQAVTQKRTSAPPVFVFVQYFLSVQHEICSEFAGTVWSYQLTTEMDFYQLDPGQRILASLQTKQEPPAAVSWPNQHKQEARNQKGNWNPEAASGIITCSQMKHRDHGDEPLSESHQCSLDFIRAHTLPLALQRSEEGLWFRCPVEHLILFFQRHRLLPFQSHPLFAFTSFIFTHILTSQVTSWRLHPAPP